MRALGGDITSPQVLALKGALFVVLGMLGSGIAIAAMLGLVEWWMGVAAHVLAVWALCRGYYFAFYVITAYADPEFRYAGLWSAGRKAWGMVRGGRPGQPTPRPSAVDSDHGSESRTTGRPCD